MEKLEDIKHEKGTVIVKQTVFTNYKLGEKATLMHKVRDDEETFEVSSSLKKDELYALKAVIESILSQDAKK